MDTTNIIAYDIKTIKVFIAEKTTVINKTILWVEKNLKYEDRITTLLNLKKALNTISKIGKNIESKPVMAVFGASQVGKSYLIKNLLSERGRPFVIRNGTDEHDFLKDINPPGVGAESTGVVTRFTIDQDIKFDGFPIRVNLLTAKDILNIVLDSFFLDLKKITTFIGKRELEMHIKAIEQNVGDIQQRFLTEYDLLEIKEYFENHLSKHTLLFEGLYETRFFERIAHVISRYEPKRWTDIFEVLWGKEVHLSQLFTRLIDTLVELRFVTKGYLQFENVLRGGGEILDVERLKELNISKRESIFKNESAEEFSVNTAYLSAVIAELILTIPAQLVESKAFLKNSDLLDFPGARSRMDIEQQNISPKTIHDMLLRGKVSYLFNKYSDDFNINNLLFCTQDRQMEVSEVSTLLFDWLSNNIGENEEDRSRTLGNTEVPPLFVIYTFFNNQLKFDSTNDSNFLASKEQLKYKWDTRFVRFFEQQLVTPSRNWHTKWSFAQPNFQNFYLLRDFKYSDDTFEGFENKGVEGEVKVDRSAFMGALKDSFLDHTFVKKHFSSPEQSWNDAAMPNNDGSELIIDNLIKVSNNNAKINHYLHMLNKLMLELSTSLGQYVHTDDITALRMSKMNQVNQFQFAFNIALSKDVDVFNDFITNLSLKPLDVYALLNANMVVDTGTIDLQQSTAESILLTQYPALKLASSKEEAIVILKEKLWLTSSSAVEQFLEGQGISLDGLFQVSKSTSKAEYYTELVLQVWKNKLANIDHFKNQLELGLSKNSLVFVTDHLLTILSKRKISVKIVKILDEVVSQILVNHGHEDFLSETFSLVFNDIAFNLDTNFFTDEERKEAASIVASTSNSFFGRKQDISAQSIAALFDTNNLDVRAIALEKYNRWIEFLRLSLLVNTGSIDYDEVANHELLELRACYTPFLEN